MTEAILAAILDLWKLPKGESFTPTLGYLSEIKVKTVVLRLLFVVTSAYIEKLSPAT